MLQTSTCRQTQVFTWLACCAVLSRLENQVCVCKIEGGI